MDRFHPLSGADLHRKTDPNIKTFKGDGTPYLRLPGCIAVEKVLLNGVELPDHRTDRVVVDLAFNRENVTEPIWSLQFTPDNEAVLMRSTLSNDGYWQDGASITVIGEWKENRKEPAK